MTNAGESFELSSSSNNYNIFTTAFGSPAVAGKFTLTIASGVTVGSTSTATVSLTVGNFPAGSNVIIINNGTVEGKGGAGGAGTYAGVGLAGGAGGDGFDATVACTIINNGTFSGGAGGGGGGGGGGFWDGKDCNPNDGGDGGDGYGTNSTLDAGLNAGKLSYGGAGGSGGAAGAAGSTGSTGTTNLSCTTYAGGAGGAAGKYSINNANVTWSVTGTRNGSASA